MPLDELKSVWENTRLVVITSMCASIYAAILIPFVVIPIIPGVTHFRPANAIPVVCSFLFGPAAAWGAAFGNLVADFFTGIGPGSFFGFWGNFFYALVPYRLWLALGGGDPLPRGARDWSRFLLVLFTASGLCAATVGWGLEVLGFVPFSVLANVILLNNFSTSLVLSPFLLAVLYVRVRRARLGWEDIAGERRAHPRWQRNLGVSLLVGGTVAALVLGNLWSVGVAGLGRHVGVGASPAAASVLPALACAILGVLLL